MRVAVIQPRTNTNLMEVLIQILFELFVQLLFELGFHSLGEPFRWDRPRNRYLAFLGYALFGGIAGGISLLIVPDHMINRPQLRVLNLVVTPIVLGLFFSYWGKLLESRGRETILLDKFAYGFAFALAMAIVRFLYAM